MRGLDRRILIVTGKGGTGKTTVAAALGLIHARRGLRTLLVECNGTRRLGPLLGGATGTYTPQRISDNLFGLSITSHEAIEDFIIKQIKVRALYTMVFKNRIMGPFMDAVPGLHDAVHLGKVYDLAEIDFTNGLPTWDRIIVDAPATGHGLHILKAPRAMMDLTRRGPIFKNAKLVHDLTSDTAQTGIVMTCLPEAMPVSESLELYSSLTESGYSVAAVVLNEMVTPPLPAADNWPSIRDTLHDANMDETVSLVERFYARQQQQCDATRELEAKTRAPVLPLPLLMDSPFQRHSIEVLADHLCAAMESE